MLIAMKAINKLGVWGCITINKERVKLKVAQCAVTAQPKNKISGDMATEEVEI